jgi:putative solute:sodium symporter small subunit
MSNKDLKQYWRTNIMYVLALLAVWFIVSYGLGILGGMFWWAQQGAIYVFVALIFVYVYLMNKLDKKYDVDEK